MPPTRNEVEEALAEEFDDSTACDYCCRYKREGLSRSSRILMSWLVGEGVSGKRIMDLGCGTGAFAIETLKNGASSCVGIDLSPAMIRKASELAVESGYQDRAKFELGNAALAVLPVSDVVVMDKVICCYPEVGPLLKNASSGSGSLIGFVVPRDEGVWKWPLRLAAYTGNLIQKIRRKKLNWFYIHSLKTINKGLVEAGFVKERKAGSRIWLVFLYKRAGI